MIKAASKIKSFACGFIIYLTLIVSRILVILFIIHITLQPVELTCRNGAQIHIFLNKARYCHRIITTFATDFVSACKLFPLLGACQIIPTETFTKILPAALSKNVVDIYSVAAVIAALLSTTFGAFSATQKLHFPARARMTFINSLAPIPACALAPFTTASAAMK